MKSKTKNAIGPTQDERKKMLGEKFTALAPTITPDMIADMMVKMLTSEDTVKRYLQGRIGKLHFGEKLYGLLIKEVEKKNRKMVAA